VLPYTKTFVQLLRFSYLPPNRLAKLALKTNDFRLYNYHQNQLSEKIKSAKTTLKYGNADLFKHICMQCNISLVEFIEAFVEFNQFFLLKEILTKNTVRFDLNIFSKVKTFQIWKLIVSSYRFPDVNDMNFILNNTRSENQKPLILFWVDYTPIDKLGDDEICFLFARCDDCMLAKIVTTLISKEFVFVPKYFYWAILFGRRDTLQIMLMHKNFKNSTFDLADNRLYENILSSDENFYRNYACEAHKCLVESGHISVNTIFDQYNGTPRQYICDYIQRYHTLEINNCVDNN
jgi:hypothetical protein